MPESAPDEYAPLCERCGYLINENEVAERCSECGEFWKYSKLSSREGTPWQRRVSFRTYIATFWGILRHPFLEFRRSAIESRKSLWLLVINLLLAGTLLASPWTGTLVGDPARGLLHSGIVGDAVFALWTVAQSVGMALILGFLTYVEYQGIRFVGRQREWRVTKTVALVICAHASVGWIVMALMPMLVLAGFYSAARFLGVTPNGTINLGSRFGQVSLNTAAQGTVLVVALFVGLLIFETLVYIGVRQCRYANRARPTENQPSIRP